jgi:predicted HTH domain antitoxin
MFWKINVVRIPVIKVSINEVRTTVNLASDFPLNVKVSEAEMPGFIKKTLALELYREGKTSLGKATELAEFTNKWEILTLLDSKGVALRYSVEDVNEDQKVL